MIKLKNIEKASGEILRLDYEVLHTNDDNTLSQDMSLKIYGHYCEKPCVKAELHITECEKPTTKEAMLKLSEWCYRLAESLEKDAEKCSMDIVF
jgi:hypothetical protein